MIIYSKHIPFHGYLAINLFGVIIIRKEYKHKITETTIRHEMIHTKQYQELLFLPMLIWYCIEYLVKLLITFDKNRAYYSVSFEQEAFKYQNTSDYFQIRKPYNWMKYIFKLKK